MYNNFEISLVVFMPNITTNHAITYTNTTTNNNNNNINNKNQAVCQIIEVAVP